MEDNYIDYRGRKIIKNAYRPVREDYLTLGSNNFELTADDLESMLNNLERKRKELEMAGRLFKDLQYEFDVNEDHSDDDYYPYDAECNIKFLYYVLETEEESKDRIRRQKIEIDDTIKKLERQKEAEKLVEDYEMSKAIDLLMKNGYSVTKK